MIKRLIKKLIAALLPVGLILALNRALRALASAAHHLQFLRQWRVAPGAPHSFDPFIDLYWRWNLSRNPMSWERGIFGLLAMKPGCRLLDLCCGEGFYTHRFYSGRAGSVIALDNNPKVISQAQRNFRAPNIEYRCGDIRTGMPAGRFDNVSWDAGIEYFTREEIGEILSAIKERLTPDGILNGYSVKVADDAGQRVNVLGQKFGAPSREALYEILGRHFENVTILRTAHADRYQERINHYFFASDGPLPFGDDWPDLQRLKSGSPAISTGKEN